MTKRPTRYSRKLAVAVCEQIAQVGSIGKACAAVGMGRATFYDWLHAHAEFVTMYQAAKEEHADLEFDRLNEMMNRKPMRDERGRVDSGYAQLLRVQLEALKYRLRVLVPRRYAEHRIEMTGAEGEPLNPPPKPSDAQFLDDMRRLAFLLQLADHKQQAPAAAQQAPAQPVPERDPDWNAMMQSPPMLPAPLLSAPPPEPPIYEWRGDRLVEVNDDRPMVDLKGDGVLYDTEDRH